MPTLGSLTALLLLLASACAPATPTQSVSVLSPSTSVASVATTAAPEPTRLTVTADDGFALTMWRKSPAHSTRSILLIHGRTWSGKPDFDLQVSGESRSFMDALVAQGYTAYALDLRGYGGTPRDGTGFLTPDRAAADTASALRAIGGKPVLFGWSNGSLVAQLTGQRTPELVSAIILFGYPADPDRKRVDAADSEQPARKATTAQAAAEDFIAPNVITKQAIAAYVEAALKADPVRVDWRHDSEWNALEPEAVHVPTLLLQAELDPYAKTDAHARLFARLGTNDRQWVVIPRGDHAALLEDTAPRMIEAIRSFVERPEPR